MTWMTLGFGDMFVRLGHEFHLENNSQASFPNETVRNEDCHGPEIPAIDAY